MRGYRQSKDGFPIAATNSSNIARAMLEMVAINAAHLLILGASNVRPEAVGPLLAHFVKMLPAGLRPNANIPPPLCQTAATQLNDEAAANPTRWTAMLSRTLASALPTGSGSSSSANVPLTI